MVKRIEIIFGILAIFALTITACDSLPIRQSGELTGISETSTSLAAIVQSLPIISEQTPEAHTAATEAVVTEAVAPTVSAPAPVHVSFVPSNRNLFVWDESLGSPIQLTTSGDVEESVISSDGQLIAFTRTSDYTSYQIDVINYDGTNQRTLMTVSKIAGLPRPSGAIVLVPSKIIWIPYTHKLAINYSARFEGPGSQNPGQLYTFDVDTDTSQVLLSIGDDIWNWNYEFSPDGSKVAVTKPLGIDLYNADGSLIQANVVTYSMVNTASEYAWTAYPYWKSDSSMFAVGILPVEPFNDPVDPGNIWTVTSAGTATNTMTTELRLFPRGVASFSPDLSKVAFVHREGVPTDNQWSLRIANIDGSNENPAVIGYFPKLPVWSPDGNRIIYAQENDLGTQIYLHTVNGNRDLLANCDALLDARWIDNNSYLFARKAGDNVVLIFGTGPSSFTTIYNGTTPSGGQIFNFDVNR